MIESNQDQVGTANNNPNLAPVRPVGRYPFWKRGIAILWVLSLCGLFGLAGLFVASFFVSFSGY
jgi:hypothetical protein